MAYGNGRQNYDNFKSWIPVLLMLVLFWPVGLILLFRKLASTTEHRQRHPYDIRREDGRAASDPFAQQGSDWREAHREMRREAKDFRQQRKDYRQDMKDFRREMRDKRRPEPHTKEDFSSLPSGQGLTIAGSIVSAIFAMGLISLVSNAMITNTLSFMITPISSCIGFMGAGLIMLFTGIQRTHKAKRYRRYLALIGKRECVSVEKLAQTMGVSKSRALNDLEEMLDKGYIPRGYLDYAVGELVLSDEGMREEPPEPEPAPAGMEREDAVLREIREVNDAIENPELSRKIDRIGEITGRIFACLRERPDKEGQLKSFLSYYLPTTLKILRAYAQMEAQGIQGENIFAAKKRIEDMMDQVVDGFEKQLDRLFQNDAMDVTSDVAVLEQMLKKDGLSGDGLQLGL